MKYSSFNSFLVSSLFLSNLVFTDTELSDAQRQLLNTLPPDQQQSVMSKMLQADQLNQELEYIFEEFDTTLQRKEKKDLTEEELNKYQEEYPKRFMKELCEYLTINPNEFNTTQNIIKNPIFTESYFSELCDKFRSPHLWKLKKNKWELRNPLK